MSTSVLSHGHRPFGKCFMEGTKSSLGQCKSTKPTGLIQFICLQITALSVSPLPLQVSLLKAEDFSGKDEFHDGKYLYCLRVSPSRLVPNLVFFPTLKSLIKQANSAGGFIAITDHFQLCQTHRQETEQTNPYPAHRLEF